MLGSIFQIVTQIKKEVMGEIILMKATVTLLKSDLHKLSSQIGAQTELKSQDAIDSLRSDMQDIKWRSNSPRSKPWRTELTGCRASLQRRLEELRADIHQLHEQSGKKIAELDSQVQTTVSSGPGLPAPDIKQTLAETLELRFCSYVDVTHDSQAQLACEHDQERVAIATRRLNLMVVGLLEAVEEDTKEQAINFLQNTLSIANPGVEKASRIALLTLSLRLCVVGCSTL
ncbi:hypothetical protein R1sor_013571 [Riccia sorocarpa]|uniref:Uncharacterized protein n=1 Tax=Riccia sorocarpa TaxID=122646 RepID=A0ABD3H9J9_9MARC